MTKKRSVLITGIIVVLCAALIAGATNAWFTSTDKKTNTIEAGRLKIEVAFDPEVTGTVYEPGMEVEMTGMLTNRGSIASISLVDWSSSVQITSDSNGDPVPESAYWTKNNDENITIEFDEEQLKYREYENGDAVYWYKAPDDQYVTVIYGKDLSTELAYKTNLDGPGMDNSYQGAKISLANNFIATQLMDGAMTKAFGFGFGDLEFIDEPHPDTYIEGSGFSTFSASTAEQRAAALFNR